MNKEFTAINFEQLLGLLSSDKAEASEKYKQLHTSLVRLFQIKGDSAPEEAADETLDRVALKCSQDNKINDLMKYSFGVAKFVFLERARFAEKEKTAATEFYSEKLSSNVKTEDEFSSLRECFDALTEDEKTILCDYFADIPFSKLNAHREKLTIKHNVSLSNLRLKIFRLRKRLENCVKEKIN